MEPSSHFFYSHRLKLQLWDYGTAGKPPLVLVHGGLDHARNWDFSAEEFCDRYHVFAYDLRGHGNSQWAEGSAYGLAEHVADLSALVDIVRVEKPDEPIRIVGHSLGGVVSLLYTGIYPERVQRLAVIEGWGPPPRFLKEPSLRLRKWVEDVRKSEKRDGKSYPDLASAIRRMKEANPHLKDEVARHLTVHGTNWNADGTLVWKFDNFARNIAPYGQRVDDMQEVISHISCPVLLFWGTESWMSDPEIDPRAQAIPNHKIVKVPSAGHWLHHDQLDLFVRETLAFLE